MMSENSFNKSYEIIIYDVLSERVRQNKKWGKQDFTPLEWLPILAEEFGEVAKVICEMYHGHRQGTSEYREELVQVAAVAIQMIENLDEQLGGEK